MEDDDLHGTPVVEAARLCAPAAGVRDSSAPTSCASSPARAADQKYTPSAS
jgi:hypothetical protein